MPEIRKIKWGILGTKWISAVMVDAIQKSTTSEVIAVGSRDVTRAMEFAQKHQIKKYYNNNELLTDPEIDAIYIGLPNHLHKEWIIRCAQAGKHILCEKPFVLNMQEAQEAFDAVKKHHVFCMEALMYRCHPFIVRLEELMDAKKIGDIQSITATYNVNIAAEENHTAGGAIRSLGCYPASLVRLLLKEEPQHILGMGKVDDKKKSDNVSVAICRFKNDVIATITTSDTIDWWWQFTIFGTKGIIDVETNPWLPSESNRLVIKIGDQTEIVEVNAEKSLYSYQIDYVGHQIIEKINEPKNPGVTWEHTLGNVAFLENWLTQVKSPSLGALLNKLNYV